MSGSESQVPRPTRMEQYQPFPSQNGPPTPSPAPLNPSNPPEVIRPTLRYPLPPCFLPGAPARPPFNPNLNWDQSNFRRNEVTQALPATLSQRKASSAWSDSSCCASPRLDGGSLPLTDRRNPSTRVAGNLPSHFKKVPPLVAGAMHPAPGLARARTPSHDPRRPRVYSEQLYRQQVADAISRPERGFKHSPDSPFVLARSFSLQAPPKDFALPPSVFSLPGSIAPLAESGESIPSSEDPVRNSLENSYGCHTPEAKRPASEEDAQYFRTTATRRGGRLEDTTEKKELLDEGEKEDLGAPPQQLCFESEADEEPEQEEGELERVFFPPEQGHPSGWFLYDSAKDVYYSEQEMAAQRAWEGQGQDTIASSGGHALQFPKFKKTPSGKRKYRKKIHGNNPAYSKGKLLTPEERQARLNKMIEKTHMVGTYTCKVCGKVFRTGQGLGGHMSKMHYGLSEFLKKNRHPG